MDLLAIAATALDAYARDYDRTLPVAATRCDITYSTVPRSYLYAQVSFPLSVYVSLDGGS